MQWQWQGARRAQGVAHDAIATLQIHHQAVMPWQITFMRVQLAGVTCLSVWTEPKAEAAARCVESSKVTAGAARPFGPNRAEGTKVCSIENEDRAGP